MAALVRLSWQPPQKRCSPARPLIQTDSFARLMRELVDQLDVERHVARNHRRERVVRPAPATSPYRDCPSNSVVPNMSTPPSSPEKPSSKRTLTTLPGVRFALMSPSDES